jgi:hypothetical protein
MKVGKCRAQAHWQWCVSGNVHQALSGRVGAVAMSGYVTCSCALLHLRVYFQPKGDHGSSPAACPLPQVASSFSHMLNLHNLTEEVANTQTERAGRMGEVRRRGGCVGGR